MQPLDAVLDGMLIAPVHEPVRGGSVEEEMFSGPLPKEVPRILRIDPDHSPPVDIYRPESSARSLLEIALPVGDGILIAAWARRHEADAKNAPIRGLEDSFHVPALLAVLGFSVS